MFNFPESYSFKCSADTGLRIFRYPSGSKIEFSNLEIYNVSSEDRSIDLDDKKIILSIGEKIDKKVKHWGQHKLWGRCFNPSCVWEKEYQSLLNSLENNLNLKNLFFGVDISEKKLRKKLISMTWYLIENFSLVNKLK